MAAEGILKITDENFEQEVLNNDLPVLVDFWASWCGPCMMLGPVIDELASESGGNYAVAKAEIEGVTQTAAKFGISAIPVVMIFQGGEVVQRFDGFTAKPKLEQALATVVQ